MLSLNNNPAGLDSSKGSEIASFLSLVLPRGSDYANAFTEYSFPPK